MKDMELLQQLQGRLETATCQQHFRFSLSTPYVMRVRHALMVPLPTVGHSKSQPGPTAALTGLCLSLSIGTTLV